jgi:hypothetical protein
MRAQDRIDRHQLKSLLKVAIKTDFRGSHNPFQNLGKGESKFPPILGVLLMQAFVSIIISVFVSKLNDAFFGSLAVNTFVLVFVSLTILLEFSNLILSPDDYAIIAPHPVNSRTFFAVKSLNFLIFISASAVVMAAAPSVVAAFVSGHWWLGPLTFLAAWSTAVATSLFFILFYTLMLRVVKRETMQRYLGYSQLLFIVVIYTGYMVLPRLLDKFESFDLQRFDSWYLYLAPPSWFACWPALFADSLRFDHLAAAIAGIACLATMIAVGMSRLSLEYALTLADTVEQQEKLVARRKRGFIGKMMDAVANNEDRAIWALIRVQFKYDNRFKTPILTIIPLTALYIFMGIQDGGTIVDPFAIVESAKVQTNFFLYLAVAFLPLMIVTSTSNSTSANASWVFFASPSNRLKLVLASTRFAVIFFCVPYLILLCGILTYFFGNFVHAALHCFIIFLMLIVMLQLMLTIMPRIPFSLPVRAGQRSLAFFAMFLIPTAFIIGPMIVLLKVGYGGPVRYLSIAAVLGLLVWLTNVLLKRATPKRLNKLEYAETT